MTVRSARSGDRTELEIGTGSVLGLGDPPPLPRPRPGMSASAALELIIREALQRPPCVVSFSGGRDSSTVLALATDVARRDGLPLPVPVTLEFPDCDTADEHEWQSAVVRRLQLADWQRIAYRDEMDIVGPIAGPVLRDKGVLWPFNAFFHIPIMDLAQGGTVLSGIFGDEILNDSWSWRRQNLLLQRRARPLPADVVRILVALGPTPLRAWFLRRRAERSGAPTPRPAWLRAEAFNAISATFQQLRAEESLSFRRSVMRVLWRLRSREAGLAAMRLLAADRGVVHVAPFAEPQFVAALVAERGWRMFRSRSEAVAHLSRGLLPEQLVTRSTKAWFDAAFFSTYSRRFVETWDGTGLDERFVDIEELRKTWRAAEPPDARTYALLQSAWLADQTAASAGEAAE